jgi:hypothetical protein
MCKNLKIQLINNIQHVLTIGCLHLIKFLTTLLRVIIVAYERFPKHCQPNIDYTGGYGTL